VNDSSTAKSTGQAGGWELKAWCEGVPLALSSYYLIPEELRPRQTKIGRKNIILESQGAWLERMAKLGGVPSRRRAA
jgi:hypothetical protein